MGCYQANRIAFSCEMIKDIEQVNSPAHVGSRIAAAWNFAQQRSVLYDCPTVRLNARSTPSSKITVLWLMLRMLQCSLSYGQPALA